MNRYLRPKGRPRFLLGVNYWSRKGGPRMWDRFDEAVVASEMAQLRNIGCNAVRAFAFLPSFVPQPPRVEAEKLAQLTKLIELADAQDLAALPSILVGHMSGENYDFPGQAGRSPYLDDTVLRWQESLCEEIAASLRGQPGLGAMVLSNEMPLWGGAASPDVVLSWASRLRASIRRACPGVPVGIGDGVMNLKGGQNGFDPASLRDVVDYLGPHTYHLDTDPYRQALNVEFLIRCLDGLGLPVVLEEFGGSSSQVGEAEQAMYVREAVMGCLATGGAGALLWCYSDLDLASEPPYSHHAFELGFGLTRADGNEKPACQEFRVVASLLSTIDLERFEPETPRAAIVVPAYLNETFPFSYEDRARMRRTLLQAFVLCARAGFEVRLVQEAEPLHPYRLLIVPAMQKLLAPSWERIERLVRQGTHLYFSYFAGDRNFHQGHWCHNFKTLTGLEPGLRYGVVDLPAPIVEIVGDGTRLRTRTEVGEAWPRSFLPVEVRDAEIVARDADGRPALTRRRLDAGTVTYLCYPWEYYLAEQIDVNESDDSYLLYRACARSAGVISDPLPSDPRVTVHRARHGHEELHWVMNRSWSAVDVKLGDLFAGELRPKETKVIRRK